jgi:hypothetical protein
MKNFVNTKVIALIAIIGMSLLFSSFKQKSNETKTITLKNIKLKKDIYTGREYFNYPLGGTYSEAMVYADPGTNSGSGTINGFYYYIDNVGTIYYSGYTASGTYSFSGTNCTVTVTLTKISDSSTIDYSGAATYGPLPNF